MNSPIANLAQNANEVQPADVAKLANGSGFVITGQYLYDNFVTSTDAEITRMGLVRKLVDQVDIDTFKRSCDSMVKKAKEIDVAQYGESTKEAPKPQPKTKSAMTVRTTLLNSYGALKYANDKLVELGYTDRTGWNAMVTLAKQALVAKGVRYDNTTPPNADQKALKKAAKEQKGEQDAFIKAMQANPRNDGESFLDYQARVAGLAEASVKEAAEKATQEKIVALAQKFIDQNGSLAGEVARMVLTVLENTEVSEMEAEASAGDSENATVDTPVDQQEPVTA